MYSWAQSRATKKTSDKNDTAHFMISIITITYDNYEDLIKTVDSLKGVEGIEHVVVNGGSCPRTKAFLDQYPATSRSEPDNGIADAFNHGIRLATGDSVLFLNSGDTLLFPEYLQESESIFVQYPDIAFIHADLVYEDRLCGDIRLGALQPFFFQSPPLGRGMPYHHQTLVVRKPVFEVTGGFKESYKISMDFDWVCRLHQAGHRGYYWKNKPVVRMDGTGLSATRESLMIWESLKALQANHLLDLKNLYGISVRIIFYLMRKSLEKLNLQTLLSTLKRRKFESNLNKLHHNFLQDDRFTKRLKQRKSEPKVYIILVNWNGWAHTLECLESLFRINYGNYKVIVCDNASEDDSVNHIRAWAKGDLDIFPNAKEHELRSFSFPPTPKPISFQEFNCEEIEQEDFKPEKDIPDLTLIQTGYNLGFAGGNNVALRYLLKRNDEDYVWLLNNDTVVDPDALQHLVSKIERVPDYGICGSTLLYYHSPNTIQSRGGNLYNPWIGHTQHAGFLEGKNSNFGRESDIEEQLDCILGSSMLVSSDFLNNVGLMSEEYFLYFEELDWVLRAKQRYEICYASKSIVFHREGGSTGGGNRNRSEKSKTADYYEIRSRLLMTRKFYPYAIPSVCLALGVSVLNRVHRRQWDRIGMIFKILKDVLWTKSKPDLEELSTLFREPLNPAQKS